MKISVAMCTYNGERFVREQLSSFVAQNHFPDELIIGDDHSSDGTWAILKDFVGTAPFDVTLIRNAKNIGYIGNFESVLGRCTGDIIFLSDQDDVWKPDKIALVTALFETTPTLGMAFSNAQLVDSQMSPMLKTLWQHMGFTGRQTEMFTADPFAFLLTDHNVVTGAAAAFSRRVINRSLPFPKNMAIPHDGWLSLIATAVGTVATLDGALIDYRQHEDQERGIRAYKTNFGVPYYTRHRDQLLTLRTRIYGLLSGPHQQLLDNYIAHLDRRLSLSTNVFSRSFQISRELSVGRYQRFSSGLRSAAKDLLRR